MNLSVELVNQLLEQQGVAEKALASQYCAKQDALNARKMVLQGKVTSDASGKPAVALFGMSAAGPQSTPDVGPSA